jgi:hypothetical protein
MRMHVCICVYIYLYIYIYIYYVRVHTYTLADIDMWQMDVWKYYLSLAVTVHTDVATMSKTYERALDAVGQVNTYNTRCACVYMSVYVLVFI